MELILACDDSPNKLCIFNAMEERAEDFGEGSESQRILRAVRGRLSNTDLASKVNATQCLLHSFELQEESFIHQYRHFVNAHFVNASV